MFQFLVRLARINGPLPVVRRAGIDLGVYRRYLTPRKALNMTLSAWRMRSGRETAGSYPYRYYIEPTNACNLRCPYCFGWQGRSDRKTGSMSLDLYKKIIDDIQLYACWVDLYNRGEPLANPAIFNMIAYANSKGVGTKISSNFHLLDEEKAEVLVSSGLDHLVVPLDGATQQSYAAYRVGGNLETVVENIRRLVRWKRKLRSKSPRITLKVLLTRHNEGEIPVIRRLAADLQVENLLFFPMFLNATDPKAVESFLPKNQKYSWYDYQRGTNRLTEMKIMPCPELWQRGTINWDGSVYPCCFVDGGPAFGNLNHESFRSIWNGASFVDSRRALLGRIAASTTICTGCRGRLKRG